MKRRVALLFHGSADLYGSDQTLIDLVSGVMAAGWAVHVALPHGGPLVDVLEKQGARVHLGRFSAFGRRTLRPLGLLALPFRFAAGVFACLRLIRSVDPDVIHINTLVIPAPAFAGRLARRPVVWHVHEIMERPAILARGLAWAVGLLSAKVVCNSKATLAQLVAKSRRVQKKGVVISNGVAIPEQVPQADARAELDLSAADFVFLFVGRLNSWKGQELFARAAGQVLAQDPAAVFLAAGDAPDGQAHFRESFQGLVGSLHMGEAFRWLGFRADTQTLYRAADVVVVPSLRPEPFGLVAAEAMAASRPVIASGHGGLGEVVEDGVTGLHVAPGDLDSLAGAMEALRRDPDRTRRMGEAGRERQGALFSLEQYQGQFVELYAELCGERGVS